MSYIKPTYDDIEFDIEPMPVKQNYNDILLELDDGELPSGGYYVFSGPIQSVKTRRAS